jgi:tubulin monoglycylase TTLL3/8
LKLFFLILFICYSRGWIEKFDRGPLLPPLHGNKKSDKRNNKSDDDDDDDDDDVLGDDDLGSLIYLNLILSVLIWNLEESPLEDENAIPPWEENDGYYGLLSRLVKTAVPDFIWSVRASYDTNTLNKDQMVNHYSRNGCFTTKVNSKFTLKKWSSFFLVQVGLCSSLKNLPWFHSGCAEEFYPRCYKLTHDDDKVAFIGKDLFKTSKKNWMFFLLLIDDYRLTSCVSFLKLIQNRCKGVIEPDMNSILAMSSDNRIDPALSTDEDQQPVTTYTILSGQASAKPVLGKISSAKKVPSSFVEFALNKVEQFTLACDHEDIDINLNAQIDSTDEQWTQFFEQFYAAAQ